MELEPKSAALTFKAAPLAGHAEVLAGETAIDEIDRTAAEYLIGSNVADVIDPLRIWPVALENG